MNSLSLAQLFGEGVFQNEENLIINKNSLKGLTPHHSNTANSLLAAIMVTSLSNFQGAIVDENNQAITDENNSPLTFDNSEIFELIKMISWKPYRITRKGQPYILHQIILFSYASN